MFLVMFLEIRWFFSDLGSARLSKQKVRLVTLDGELLEASGAITGGSKLNKDLAYRFGTNNDIDDSSHIKERLLIIEAALKESKDDLIIILSASESFSCRSLIFCDLVFALCTLSNTSDNSGVYVLTAIRNLLCFPLRTLIFS